MFPRIALIGTAITAGYIAFSATSWWWQGKMDDAMALAEKKSQEAVKFAHDTCKKNATITKGANDAILQGKDDIARQLADAYERLRDQGKTGLCVPVAGKAELGTDTTDWTIPRGVVAESLYQLGADHDRAAVTANACIKFVDDLIASKKNPTD